MSDVYQIDKGVLQWLIGASGALLLFFFGLGVKDLRDKLNKLPAMCVELEKLHGKILVLEARINDLSKD